MLDIEECGRVEVWGNLLNEERRRDWSRGDRPWEGVACLWGLLSGYFKQRKVRKGGERGDGHFSVYIAATSVRKKEEGSSI